MPERRSCDQCAGAVADHAADVQCAAGCGGEVYLCAGCAAARVHPNEAYVCWFCGLARSGALDGVADPASVHPRDDLDAGLDRRDVDDDPLDDPWHDEGDGL